MSTTPNDLLLLLMQRYGVLTSSSFPVVSPHISSDLAHVAICFHRKLLWSRGVRVYHDSKLSLNIPNIVFNVISKVK